MGERRSERPLAIEEYHNQSSSCDRYLVNGVDRSPRHHPGVLFKERLIEGVRRARRLDTQLIALLQLHDHERTAIQRHSVLFQEGHFKEGGYPSGLLLRDRTVAVMNIDTSYQSLKQWNRDAFVQIAGLQSEKIERRLTWTAVHLRAARRCCTQSPALAPKSV